MAACRASLGGEDGGSSGGGGGKGSTGSDGAGSTGLGLKAVWVGAEAFGNVVGATKGGQQQQRKRKQQGGGEALSRQEAVALIKEDYSKNYFISGKRRTQHSRGHGHPVELTSAC